jgi:transposase
MLALTYQPAATQPTTPAPTKAPTSDPAELRRQRGLAIAAVCRITKKHDQWIVPSQTGNGTYRVTLDPPPFVPMCTCPDYEERAQPCKHVYAVQYAIERETNGQGVETVTEAETVTITKKTCAKKPTYKQVWPAYNAAQVNEKHKFQVLLHDLCTGIIEPPRPRRKGMQPLRLADAIFSAVFKVYSTVSGRRFSCDLADAFAKGYMERLPHYNTVFTYLENPNLTPILRALIVESARPLKTVEVDFAADSSGFTSTRFVRWFDHKYGKPMQKHDWVKVSVMTGVKTNVVAAVEVDERYAADCPQFKPLLKTTAGNFTIREVSADTAFSSYENMDAVAAVGGTPYIAFKSNANPKGDGMYTKMFHLYSLNRDDYLTHYHKRSNVETTFSMIKAKFGDHVRSKTDIAMANEALAKVLCHNICCMIQSMYELGINPIFWGKEEVDEAETGTIPAPGSDDLIDMFAWM